MGQVVPAIRYGRSPMHHKRVSLKESDAYDHLDNFGIGHLNRGFFDILLDHLIVGIAK